MALVDFFRRLKSSELATVIDSDSLWHTAKWFQSIKWWNDHFIMMKLIISFLVSTRFSNSDAKLASAIKRITVLIVFLSLAIDGSIRLNCYRIR